MSLSRKHFQSLADILKGARKALDHTDNPEFILDKIERDIIVFCKQENQSFDSQRFVQTIHST